MTSIPTVPNAISWQNIYNVVNRNLNINEPIIPGTNVSLGGFGGTIWSDGTSVPLPPQPISILTHFSGKSLAGGADRIPVEPFMQELNAWLTGCEQIWCQGPQFDMVILCSIVLSPF